ncbi:tyrosine-type recombinase/integrase [Megalodesulfovibrio gigas]|uniref:Putative integrase family protein n=1 Tax=Megalodesulfovibrio gigas (strain ATCC 19364 / DSM 1382 / NCIMB 9332 / VKM B-1759) TaxID=1121448 RepID=T2GDI0_MEGG1|nr:site-specific integrase [Megalodesulfovibrio gigas]AGW14171.1 putative integrase family protein [Megalodesulfovibrio gigas DSM 1382 = ATCC 19364]
MYLELSKAGGKLWRWKYRFEGKEKRLALGAWPDVSLKEAREKRDIHGKVLQEGQDPGVASRKKVLPVSRGMTFEYVARDWIAGRMGIWSQRHAETVVDRLVTNVYPALDNKPVAEIVPADVLWVVQRIEERGSLEVAKRVLGICSQIFQFAVARLLITSDPCRDLRGALCPRVKSRFAALTTPDEAGELMRRIDEYQGTAVVRAALVFSALTFNRPGPIRHAEWDDIDYDARQWVVPADKMKLTKEMKLRGEPHIVPLATQTILLLSKVQHFTGRGRYIFPNPRNKDLPMSENAVNVAIRRMGYTKEQMTTHGFRSMASTLLNEAGFRHDVIEAQLAHTSADKIRAIYNRAQYKEERRALMQAWADMLDTLRSEAVARAQQHRP